MFLYRVNFEVSDYPSSNGPIPLDWQVYVECKEHQLQFEVWEVLDRTKDRFLIKSLPGYSRLFRGGRISWFNPVLPKTPLADSKVNAVQIARWECMSWNESKVRTFRDFKDLSQDWVKKYLTQWDQRRIICDNYLTQHHADLLDLAQQEQLIQQLRSL